MTIGWIFDSEIFDMIELLVRKKSMREYEWCTGEKNEYSLLLGCCRRQLSPRPKSLMNCFMVSADFQMRLLPKLLHLSIVGSITVLKSPAIMTGQLEKFEIEEKKVWKKDGSSVFGPYKLPIVTGLLLMEMFMIMKRPSGSVMVVL